MPRSADPPRSGVEVPPLARAVSRARRVPLCARCPPLQRSTRAFSPKPVLGPQGLRAGGGERIRVGFRGAFWGKLLCVSMCVAQWARELFCLASSVGLFAAYGWHLRRDTRAATPKTAAGVMRPLREQWLMQVIAEGKDILCVQTLRNWTMVATTMASASMLAGVGALGFAVSQAGLLQSRRSSLMSWFSSEGGRDSWLATKIFLLGFVLLWTFMHFASAMRYYTHITVCVFGSSSLQRRQTVALCLLRHATRHSMTGLRSLYASSAVALWTLGAWWLLGGSLGIVGMLRHLDTLDARESAASD